MKVHHLNCGNMRVYRFHKSTAICHCLLIEADDGLILVDSGIGTADMADLTRLGPMHLILNIKKSIEDTASFQVRKLGYSEKDVKHIVLTHLDFDHTGGIQDFPQARVHVFKPEYEAAARPSTFTERQRYRREHLVSIRRWATYDHVSSRDWYGLDCIRNLEGLPGDIILVPLPGHTRGHCAVAVKEDGKWLLHAGDGYYHHHQMGREPSCPLYLAALQGCVHVRFDLAGQARERLWSIANKSPEEITVFCTHDVLEFARLRG